MNIRQAAAGAAALDAGAILVFSSIGRASHEEGILGANGLGLATTVWPFLVGAGIGWAIARGWKRPCDWRRTGTMVWASTLVGGMLLRAVSGQGVQLSFVVVAGTFLALFLIGWRVLSGFIAKRRGLKP
ncbi:DUF3054 domain-containing protein [Demequina capsici]|uniref:DUF3054 domain-containing protein n=1 Tax=Demequina capsici TaxID=3075620 RepID=A0AA96F517_9MICO|nr:DUF3054 domain-containing protein [Demequina sp. OYTSA14]WNM23988.1 DUF3054 domain-containing protein [Demequina sp. OYTSA14]